MTTRRTRVLVADDHPLYREGVVRAIKERPELELVGECDDGRAALEQIRELEPDVALLDVKMPLLDGTAVLNAVDREKLPTRGAFLSAYLDAAGGANSCPGGGLACGPPSRRGWFTRRGGAGPPPTCQRRPTARRYATRSR